MQFIRAQIVVVPSMLPLHHTQQTLIWLIFEMKIVGKYHYWLQALPFACNAVCALIRIPITIPLQIIWSNCLFGFFSFVYFLCRGCRSSFKRAFCLVVFFFLFSFTPFSFSLAKVAHSITSSASVRS